MSPVELLPPAAAVPSNPRWHELRRAGISASEIAAVMGLSPWQSPFGLYWAKVEGWRSDVTPEMEWGTRLEDAVATKWADEHDDVYLYSAGLYHGAEPWQLATPDRLVCNAVDGHMRVAQLLECKTSSDTSEWGEPGTDDIPVWYRAQALWQLDVLDLVVCNIAVLIRGSDYREYTILRDEEDLRVMRAAGERFMARLANNDPPPIDGHPATIRALKAVHPSIVDVDVEVPVEFAEGYRRARAMAARAEAVKDRWEARAREKLGDARRLMCNRRLVCSRSIYDQSGDTAELLALDGQEATVDRLNPGRATSYLIPKVSTS